MVAACLKELLAVSDELWAGEMRLPCARCSPLIYAQVGEWLKPTDCKSVPPCEVRRFESFPVHQIVVESGVNRFFLAMITYATLAALAIATLNDQRIRAVTLAVL